MLVQDIIRKKRDGEELTQDQISWFVSEMTSDNISESQIAAFAMAIFLQRMTFAERINLTKSMTNSGKRLSWNLSGPVIDKHSTGGIGDSVSLLLAPALASCGGFVPMISGRGLGHTGGTLDKLDSIPGYNSQPSTELLKKTVKSVGCAIVGQTEEIAPADKRLYAIRDVTATVDSIDLITSSILSKKIAAGLNALVLDIKCGNGAFMASRNDAQNLANSLVKVGEGLGCYTSAILTNMTEPLCSSVGNSLEILKVVDVFRGDAKEERLMEVVYTLGGKILEKAGLASNFGDGLTLIKKTFESGQAAEKFEKMVASLGGNSNFLIKASHELPKAPLVQDIYVGVSGYVTFIDCRAIGTALLELGGARRRSHDLIDCAVGFKNLLGIGQWVDNQVPLARIHARDKKTLDLATSIIVGAYRIDLKKIGAQEPIILEHIG